MDGEVKMRTVNFTPQNFRAIIYLRDDGGDTSKEPPTDGSWLGEEWNISYLPAK